MANQSPLLKLNTIYILAGDMGCNNPESRIPTPHPDQLTE